MEWSPPKHAAMPHYTGQPPAAPAWPRPPSTRPCRPVNQRPEPVPANVRQPRKRIARLPIVAEIDDERPAFDRRLVHESPIPRIRRIVPIVAKDEVLPLRHYERAPVVARRVLTPRVVRPAHEVASLPPEVGVGEVVLRSNVLHIRLGQRGPVHLYPAGPHRHRVPGHAAPPLDVVDGGVPPVLEHDDGAALSRA